MVLILKILCNFHNITDLSLVYLIINFLNTHLNILGDGMQNTLLNTRLN